MIKSSLVIVMAAYLKLFLCTCKLNSCSVVGTLCYKDNGIMECAWCMDNTWVLK